MYLSFNGTLYDPLNAYQDTLDRKVTFIGDVSDRIQEDHLRILRYLRFSSKLNTTKIRTAELEVCCAEKALLLRISKEKIKEEISRKEDEIENIKLEYGINDDDLNNKSNLSNLKMESDKKLENEIKALKEMLTIDKNNNNQGQSNLDSSRFAMLDNELQSLQKTLFQAMTQDSSDAARRAQAKIESEIALREEEKKAQDSLIQEKLLH